jgi:hypothetical protein
MMVDKSIWKNLCGRHAKAGQEMWHLLNMHTDTKVYVKKLYGAQSAEEFNEITANIPPEMVAAVADRADSQWSDWHAQCKHHAPGSQHQKICDCICQWAWPRRSN